MTNQNGAYIHLDWFEQWVIGGDVGGGGGFAIVCHSPLFVVPLLSLFIVWYSP